MELAPSISQIAMLLADPKRSAMVWALIDGSPRASEELAQLVGLSPSSASAHLARLSAGGLLKLEARGRKRFFKLAAPEVGAAVEALASVLVANADLQVSDGSPVQARPPLSMRKARACQDHLGGEVAVELFQRMLDAGWIEKQDQRLEVTQKGSLHFARYGIFIQALAHREHHPVCGCSEWNDRRPHLGGALGASLMKLFIQSGWLRTCDVPRALQLTATGAREIGKIAREVELMSAV
ncbi:MAG: helix-turn-helix transcriptional regulator [Pseudomonas sp.]|uniref:ArsR/SmtB family transcription factor n=1 Tax=Pseudomonas abieticivorans TaxID=2931382 RepID=UPI0020BEBEA8|nr:helix-turn-helix transcriptional regulator [Pseudomonas sp. PIA16]MDE1165733.1 helix-turn-helix transcriptional regulator [Pseudomonas sp.]